MSGRVDDDRPRKSYASQINSQLRAKLKVPVTDEHYEAINECGRHILYKKTYIIIYKKKYSLIHTLAAPIRNAPKNIIT